MKKIVLAVSLAVFFPLAVFSQSPLAADTGLRSLYQETDDYCTVEHIGRLHYWLYNTYNNKNGDASDLFKAFISYAEKLGWAIDFDNTEILTPNNDLASPIKTMMVSKKSDMAMTIIEIDNVGAMFIHNHDEANDVWETIMFPLYK